MVVSNSLNVQPSKKKDLVDNLFEGIEGLKPTNIW